MTREHSSSATERRRKRGVLRVTDEFRPPARWGCIALRSDERIDEVAAWVREKKVTRVEFRE